MNEYKISWFAKIILKLAPSLYFRHFAKNIGLKYPIFEQAHKLFSLIHRIDIIPTVGAGGFILILDKKTSLFFIKMLITFGTMVLR